MEVLFNDYHGAKLNINEVLDEVFRYMNDDEERRYKIIIGTDSEGYNGGLADFVTAIVVVRVGAGGRYFWRRVGLGRIHTLRLRVIQEALFSIETAKEVLAGIKSRVAASTSLWSLEIHADVGENGETRSLIQEVVGMIRANNFEVKTKPESYAATKVADRHV